MRARVTCSESIANSDAWNGNYEESFLATGDYWQGESEDWKFSVTSVAEPSTLALFGLGLAGLVAARRKA